MRKDYLVTKEKETYYLEKLPAFILEKFPHLSSENTLVLMVSPDYSASAAMHVAHSLSKDGEMCNVLPIHVHYPDEENILSYLIKAENDINDYEKFCGKEFENFLLVEAAVIKGNTYTWLTDIIKKNTSANIVTSTLFENIDSKFKSDIVVEYYNDTVEDLTFYYEKENKHWK